MYNPRKECILQFIFMLRPHAQGVASGSLGTVVLKLLLDSLSAPHPVPVSSFSDSGVVECEVDRSVELSPELPEWLLGLDLRSVVVGIAIGVVFGPVIDFVYLLRVWWAQSVHRTQSRLQRIGHSLYRLLE